MHPQSHSQPRIAWVDYSKGICIILVVMMHSVLGVQEAFEQTSFLDGFVAFARPFRMPDFFLLSGLFLANVINRDWRLYLDRKVVHFAYFYVLWLTIQAAYKFPPVALNDGIGEALRLYALAFIDPFGSLWFIYLLPVFFVVCKLIKNVPVWLILLIGVALETARLHTGWIVIDEFAARFLYFTIGWLFAPQIFAFAETVGKNLWIAVSGIAVWAIVNAWAVHSGVAFLPLVSIAFGLAGVGALIAISVWLARSVGFGWLRYLGEHTIVVFLSYMIPMAMARVILQKLGVDVHTAAVLTTFAGVGLPIIAYWIVRNTPLWFFYERPKAFYLKGTLPDAQKA